MSIIDLLRAYSYFQITSTVKLWAMVAQEYFDRIESAIVLSTQYGPSDITFR